MLLLVLLIAYITVDGRLGPSPGGLCRGFLSSYHHSQFPPQSNWCYPKRTSGKIVVTEFVLSIPPIRAFG